ncbi:RsmB/NOP family class I SAM-dependent RNA methyltransferase [Sphingomonas sp.]|jgi:16S rRNA (cytosine967-C5)-methyltransferase|uniref:RsmB/NOP family class I SAM-dependent RNA methyltransferase n=1 Tax=Sphingomonas sp. TaxID=28214 RepID=UPI002D7F03D8|nr:RsmB/NOP family class I SAM-dependent RNA methyltransferase [Sphingomonas sp.]HEU0044721.1 RsmB/NOP family class I SAM-dependent RNA methyltransferase [Sphingomonas sp.]
MTPPARTQAAIELLDAIIAAAREGGAAADTLIQRYFATRRYAGSKDRRAVRELVYAAIRAAGERPGGGRAAMLLLADRDAGIAATFDGEGHGPPPIHPDEPKAKAGVVPIWLGKRLTASGIGRAEQEALVARAPLDLRVNTLLASPAEVAAETGGELIPGLPAGVRLPTGTDVSALAGRAEIQDAGSQVVTLAARARRGQNVIDLCAGAGGKSLALAAVMDNDGAIIATDTDRGRLSHLLPRAERAGASIIATRLLDPGHELSTLTDVRGRADTVLIDAPCSGSGTWRRNPEARWRLTPDRIERLVATQARLIGIGAALVRPGGALVFIVCSLLDEEGRGQVAAFLADRPDWAADPLDLPAGRAHGDGWRLDPAHDGTDGFFVARLLAPC